MEKETIDNFHSKRCWYSSPLLLFLLCLAGAMAVAICVLDVQLKRSEAQLLVSYRMPQPKPDTVIIHHRYTDTVRIIEHPLPKTVYVYTKPDTLRRQRLERDTMISGLRLDGKNLEVELLTPKGVSVIESYPLVKDVPTLVAIAADGRVELTVDERELKREKRHRRWRRIGMVGCLVVGVIMGQMAKN